MAIERITRRSFLIGSGAAVLTAALPAIAENAPEYARFMCPPHMWHRDLEGDYVQFNAGWRVSGDGISHQAFGLGVRVSAEDIAERRTEKIMRSFNRALENTRVKYGFPREMIYKAARSAETARWSCGPSGLWVQNKPLPHRFGLIGFA